MTPNSPDSKNTITFIIIALVIMLGYQALVIEPAAKKRQALMKQQAIAAQTLTPPTGTAPQTAVVDAPPAVTPRVAIAAPGMVGSINLAGAVFDDIKLAGYHETLSDQSPLVTLFKPQGQNGTYYSQLGWSGGALIAGTHPMWTQIGTGALSPATPVQLRYETTGLRIDRVVSVDDGAMLTIKDTVTNTSVTPVAIAPYGLIRRTAPPKGPASVAHEGFIGWLGDRLEDRKYKKVVDKGAFQKDSTGGWVGITDKYWMAALIPAQGEVLKGEYRADPQGNTQLYTASMLGAQRTLGAGQAITTTTHLFAGAKRVQLIEAYGEKLGIQRFDLAIDWGMFWFLTKPFFKALEFFATLAKNWGVTANFGVGILMLTVVVKVLFFPLANASYAAMTKMKKVQPQVDELRAKNKDDLQKLNTEMMALYAREKINPMAGCLPMLIQIPVFFSLYKTLVINLEMRHAPFYGWVHDLSAPDPTKIFNLFGLLPFDPTTFPVVGSFMALGAWPVLMGLTMWAQMSMNPPAQDPVQRQMFAFMPLLFTFMLAHFAAGLVIYWVWSNILSIGQQYWMMRKYQVDTPLDAFLAKVFKRPSAANG
jgi:YidC/Oxa1 family membrane protein insertase